MVDELHQKFWFRIQIDLLTVNESTYSLNILHIPFYYTAYIFNIYNCFLYRAKKQKYIVAFYNLKIEKLLVKFTNSEHTSYKQFEICRYNDRTDCNKTDYYVSSSLRNGKCNVDKLLTVADD